MLRMFVLFVAMLTLSVSTGAQSVEWKAIACTAERPEMAAGLVYTFYFTEGGQVHFGGQQYQATVSTAEITFCREADPQRKLSRTCYTISRISGQFSSYAAGAGLISAGRCVAQSDRPKF